LFDDRCRWLVSGSPLNAKKNEIYFLAKGQKEQYIGEGALQFCPQKKKKKKKRKLDTHDPSVPGGGD
jgi:hypothetical protein